MNENMSGGPTPGPPEVYTLPDRVGLISDVHGNERFAADAALTLVEAGAEALIQLGDFGVLFADSDAEWKVMNRLTTLLDLLDVDLAVVPGNHDPYNLINGLDLEGNRRRATHRITYVERGARAHHGSGTSVAFVSGAGSVDRYARVAGQSWFPEEELTDEQIAAIVAEGPADVLLAHDAPTSAALSERLQPNASLWSATGLQWAKRLQQRFNIVHRAVRPAISVSGHYHLHLDERIEFEAETAAFTSRAVILDQERRPKSIAILDLRDLTLTYPELVDSRPRERGFRDLLRDSGHTEREIAEHLGIRERTLRQVRNGHIPAPYRLIRKAQSLPGLFETPWRVRRGVLEMLERRAKALRAIGVPEWDIDFGAGTLWWSECHLHPGETLAEHYAIYGWPYP